MACAPYHLFLQLPGALSIVGTGYIEFNALEAFMPYIPLQRQLECEACSEPLVTCPMDKFLYGKANLHSMHMLLCVN